MSGKIVGLGLGPGDPDLMSVRARRTLERARHVAYFRKRGHAGLARRIVEGLLPADVCEWPLDYPVTTELAYDSAAYDTQLAAFYDRGAEQLATLAAQHEVVVLCEGDPLFYGSFMHLYVRLCPRVLCEIVPGIPGMVGCWAAAGLPMTWGDDSLVVLAGTLPAAELQAKMAGADALVIMKVRTRLPQVRAALAAVGRLDEALLVEYGTWPQQRVRRLREVDEPACPYFSLVLVPGHGRRPGGAA